MSDIEAIFMSYMRNTVGRGSDGGGGGGLGLVWWWCGGGLVVVQGWC